jgi:hypothetical protein
MSDSLDGAAALTGCQCRLWSVRLLALAAFDSLDVLDQIAFAHRAPATNDVRQQLRISVEPPGDFAGGRLAAVFADEKAASEFYG